MSKINVKNIEATHTSIKKNYITKKKVNYLNDQDIKIYKYLYKIDKGYSLTKKNNRGSFLKLYDKFIIYLAKNIFKENIVYQSKPTLRVHWPNNLAVGDFHRDRDYNHPNEEINFWVPITKANNTNTIWIESDYDKKDYRPINLLYGQYIYFDSGLLHGNKMNIENKTRISFDFRIIPASKWDKNKYSKKKSISRKKKFIVGDYYKITNI